MIRGCGSPGSAQFAVFVSLEACSQEELMRAEAAAVEHTEVTGHLLVASRQAAGYKLIATRYSLLATATTYHFSPTTYYLPPSTHLPSTTYHLIPTTYYLPPTTYLGRTLYVVYSASARNATGAAKALCQDAHLLSRIARQQEEGFAVSRRN